MVTYPNTNGARRRVILLIETNVLPLSQAATATRLGLVAVAVVVVCFFVNLSFSRITQEVIIIIIIKNDSI